MSQEPRQSVPPCQLQHVSMTTALKRPFIALGPCAGVLLRLLSGPVGMRWHCCLAYKGRQNALVFFAIASMLSAFLIVRFLCAALS